MGGQVTGDAGTIGSLVVPIANVGADTIEAGSVCHYTTNATPTRDGSQGYSQAGDKLTHIEVVKYDAGIAGTAGGVTNTDIKSGENGTMVVNGFVYANVGAAVTVGARLEASAGALITNAGGTDVGVALHDSDTNKGLTDPDWIETSPTRPDQVLARVNFV